MDRLDELLRGLPAVDDRGAGLAVTGQAMPGPAGRLRLVAGGLYVDVGAEDVIGLRPLPSDDGAGDTVEAGLRCGARLFGIGPAAALGAAAARGGVPFAARCRPPEQAHRVSVEKRRRRFHLKERAFLARYGLIGAEAEA